jgi:hypothetical protein
MDMHWKIGICQDARKHKERGGGFCPRWFAQVPSKRNSTNNPLACAQVPQNVCAVAPLRLYVEKSIFLQADQRVGQWSDVVSIPVAG